MCNMSESDVEHIEYRHIIAAKTGQRTRERAPGRIPALSKINAALCGNA